VLAGKQQIPRFARNDNLLKFCAGLSSADTGVSPASVLVALSPPTLSQRTRKSGAPFIYVWFGFLRDGPPGEATFVSVGPDLSDVLRNACIDPSLGVARCRGRLRCLRMTIGLGAAASTYIACVDLWVRSSGKTQGPSTSLGMTVSWGMTGLSGLDRFLDHFGISDEICESIHY